MKKWLRDYWVPALIIGVAIGVLILGALQMEAQDRAERERCGVECDAMGMRMTKGGTYSCFCVDSATRKTVTLWQEDKPDNNTTVIHTAH